VPVEKAQAVRSRFSKRQRVGPLPSAGTPTHRGGVWRDSEHIVWSACTAGNIVRKTGCPTCSTEKNQGGQPLCEAGGCYCVFEPLLLVPWLML
jgi:hypothetical protein